MPFEQIISAIIGLGSGLGASVILKRRQAEAKLQQTRRKAKKMVEDAKREAEDLRKEAKNQRHKAKEEAVADLEFHQKRVERQEESLDLKQKQVQSRIDKNKHLEDIVKEAEDAINALKKEMEDDTSQMVEALLSKTGANKENILSEAQVALVNEVTSRRERTIKKRVEMAEEDSFKCAHEVLVQAIQRYADESSVDRTVTTVKVKNERFKPDLIGRDGENIEKFEELVDVEVIFNDYPKIITVGGYSVLKRQIGKEAIELLKRHRGKITPALVEEKVKEAEGVVDAMMIREAQKACKKIGLQDVPEGLLRYIGRLHFRTSYGQNALKHCLEVGFFAGIIAGEIGADIEVARFAGFFHDVGKAISEESDKGHDYLTKDILEEFEYPEEIIHAAWVHHEAEPAKTLEAKIVMAADALSASRPGARLESLERYLERIRALESTAASFPGIKKTFAISAGREVRVIVRPEDIDDKTMLELASNIADKIEEELTYPGNVKVNVIRRRKWNATAKGRKK